jgi:hypothetical protein
MHHGTQAHLSAPSLPSASVSVYSSYNWKAVVRLIFSSISVLGNYSGKDVLAASKISWRHQFLCGPYLIEGESASLFIPLSLVSNAVKTFPGQRRIFRGLVFMGSLSYERKVGDWVLPRTSCFIIWGAQFSLVLSFSLSFYHSYPCLPLCSYRFYVPMTFTC